MRKPPMPRQAPFLPKGTAVGSMPKPGQIKSTPANRSPGPMQPLQTRVTATRDGDAAVPLKPMERPVDGHYAVHSDRQQAVLSNRIGKAGPQFGGHGAIRQASVRIRQQAAIAQGKRY